MNLGELSKDGSAPSRPLWRLSLAVTLRLTRTGLALLLILVAIPLQAPATGLLWVSRKLAPWIDGKEGR